MIRWLERRFGWMATPYLTHIILAGMVFTFLVGIADPTVGEQLLFEPGLVLAGEVWRLFTFFFVTPTISPAAPLRSALTIVFFIFTLNLLWLFGTALDHYWGTFRFNLYVLTGYVLTVAAGFIAGQGWATNLYFYSSLFLAFAYLYPDYVFRLFGILPIRAKWLALLDWLFYAFMLVMGPNMARLLVVAAVGNFLIFFHRELLDFVRRKRRSIQRQAQAAVVADEPFHKCVVCGRTDQSHPKLEFRYCNRCAGAPCYCDEHLRTHEHR